MGQGIILGVNLTHVEAGRGKRGQLGVSCPGKYQVSAAPADGRPAPAWLRPMRACVVRAWYVRGISASTSQILPCCSLGRCRCHLTSSRKTVCYPDAHVSLPAQAPRVQTLSGR